MTDLLETDEHEVIRFELLKKVEAMATTDAGYAIAFILWDVVGQLVDLNKRLRAIEISLDDICEKIPEPPDDE